jgi:hypothetical protein
MKSLSISAATASLIVDDPALLRNPQSIGLDSSTAEYILDHGFAKGFRSLFLMHACMAVTATVASVLMIKHKSLTRGDEVQLKQEGKKWSTRLRLDKLKKVGKDEKSAGHAELPTGAVAAGPSSSADVDVELGDLQKERPVGSA